MVFDGVVFFCCVLVDFGIVFVVDVLVLGESVVNLDEVVVVCVELFVF